MRDAASQLDIAWARSRPARFVRERFMQLVLNPVMDFYAARSVTGRETVATLEQQPVILVSNHASHMDTPVILSALPRRLRKRTAVVAAADYFYRNRFVAAVVSLVFNTVPIDRLKHDGELAKSTEHLDALLDQGWNLLLYPEGTRSRKGVPGNVRRGAAVLAASHHLAIIPIRLTGTAEAMPPGQRWPRRLRGRLRSRRHRIEVTFGEAIPPNPDIAVVVDQVQSFFANGDGGSSLSAKYRRLTSNPKVASAPEDSGVAS